MADYINIKGSTIQYLDSDPANPVVGQVWYNSTTQTLKGASAGGATAGTWSSGGNLNTARQQTTGCGIQTAGLCVGGEGAPPGGLDTAGAFSEEYDGSSWTEGNDLNTKSAFATALGLQTAALVVGGYNPSSTLATNQSYNGTSYTEDADIEF